MTLGGGAIDSSSDVDECETTLALNAAAPEFRPAICTGIRHLADASFMRADAAEFIPTVAGWAALQAFQPKQHAKCRQMPPASEEEWESRINKREKEVMTIKALQSYRMYAEVFPPALRGEEDPMTPDPRDRNISKRMWKWNVEKWRLQLKSRCVYSRAAMLQCREVMRTHPEGQEQDSESANGPLVTCSAAVASASSVARAEREAACKQHVVSADASRLTAAADASSGRTGAMAEVSYLTTVFSGRLSSMAEMSAPPGITAAPCTGGVVYVAGGNLGETRLKTYVSAFASARGSGVGGRLNGVAPPQGIGSFQ